MSYTYEDVQKALEKQIDYASLAHYLELDLNTIAAEVVTDPTRAIEFVVFFDVGEFNTTITQQEAGEGDGMYPTPILLKFINGDYSTMRGPQFFSTVFSIEVLGFARDRENLRKIFETYSSLNQGIIEKNNEIYMTKTLEFPFFGQQVPLKGIDRVQGFMRLFINYMYSGQMSNDVKYYLDGEEVLLQGFTINRQRNVRSDQMNEITEVTNIYESQILTFSGSMIYDGSRPSIKLFRNIKTLNSGLNQQFILTIVFPNIRDEILGWALTANADYSLTYNTVVPPITDQKKGDIIKITNRVQVIEKAPSSYIHTISLSPATVLAEDVDYILEQVAAQNLPLLELIQSGGWNNTNTIRAEMGAEYKYFTFEYIGDKYYAAVVKSYGPVEEESYKVYLDTGSISVDEGGVVVLSASFSIAEV